MTENTTAFNPFQQNQYCLYTINIGTCLATTYIQSLKKTKKPLLYISVTSGEVFLPLKELLLQNIYQNIRDTWSKMFFYCHLASHTITGIGTSCSKYLGSTIGRINTALQDASNVVTTAKKEISKIKNLLLFKISSSTRAISRSLQQPLPDHCMM